MFELVTTLQVQKLFVSVCKMILMVYRACDCKFNLKYATLWE